MTRQMPGLVAVVGYASGGSNFGDREKLRDAVATQRSTGGVLRVVGHASRDSGAESVRRDLTNFRMSLDRAQAVARGLVELGVPADRVLVDARSDNELADPVNPASSANRRAEIYLEY